MNSNIKSNPASLILIGISLILLIIFSITVGVIGFMFGNGLQSSKSSVNLTNVSATCISENGHWFAQSKECEYISEPKCREMGGTFDACASPCRNNKDKICIQMCVQVCSFN